MLTTRDLDDLKDGAFSKHDGNKTKMREQIALCRTKYFTPPATKESGEEEPAIDGENVQHIENLQMKMKVTVMSTLDARSCYLNEEQYH